MNYGLYLSASGVLTNMHRQDVIANNLANANTTGFKRALAAFRQRDPETLEDLTDLDAQQDVLDRIGGGAFANRAATDFTVGSFDQTGNDLDIAIRGEGFLAVRQTNEAGEASVRLTRDGRFTVNPAGYLVTTVGGHEVLDANDQPITIDRSQRVRVDGHGHLLQGGQSAAKLGLWQVTDPQQLQQRGGGLFEASPELLDSRQPSEAVLQQGWVEQSNVDPIREITAMIEATRAIANSSNLIRYQDAMLERAVTQLGRVTA
jgi:flagellar basal-body rod protein FlgF